MRVSRLNSVNFYRTFLNVKKEKSHVLKEDNFERISFKGNLPYEISSKLPKKYSIDDLVLLAQDEKNLRGIGANSKVYNIPYLDDYVLKVLNKNDPNQIKINEFPATINLGQPVWQSEKNPRHLILRKVEGVEHSIPSWSNTIWDTASKKPLLVSDEQVQVYFNSVEKLANMSQEAFDEIAYKVKLLDEKDYKIDSINPNNLIVDENEIHIIDYFKVKPKEKNVYQNCSYDLVAIMLDFTLLPEYFEKMDSEQKNKFLRNAKVIFEKVQQGAKNSGLSDDVEIYKTYISETSKWFVTTSAFEKDGREHIRLYDHRMRDFLIWLEEISSL